MKQLLIVGFGGFIGSVARYLVQKLNNNWSFLALPIGTLTVNILGSFIIGLLVGISSKNNTLPHYLQLFLMVGFCGGFTTFSAFTSENMTLIQNGQFLTVILYIGLSVCLGLAAVYTGYLTSNIF